MVGGCWRPYLKREYGELFVIQETAVNQQNLTIAYSTNQRYQRQLDDDHQARRPAGTALLPLQPA